MKLGWRSICYLVSLAISLVEHRWNSSDRSFASTVTLQIAVLSARENFQKRQTIRETWWKHCHHNNQVRARFVIGSRNCPVSLPDRINQYECRSGSCAGQGPVWLFSPTARPIRRTFRGFSLVVHRDWVKLTKVAVHRTVIDRLAEPVNLQIIDAFTKNLVFELKVTRENPQINDFYFHEIESRDLGRGSTLIVMITDDVGQDRLPLRLHDQACFVEILRSYPGFYDHESLPFDHQSHSFYVNLEFDYFKPNQSLPMAAWSAKQERIQQQLLKEWDMYQDIVFVDMIDVYRELPRKFLLYIEQLKDQATHLLKTDDDCFVNIPDILELIADNIHHRTAWFGNFRRMWPVNYYGKWSDSHYTGPYYPAFACGSGYVLTWNIVDWLRQNSRRLFFYQGEDVSMGIWLAAINPLKIEDDRWICGNDREPDRIRNALSVPQIEDRETMAKIWLGHQ